MTDVPAAWYDDPEDPSQYRYWDGSAWTEHRSPKSIPDAPRSRQGVIGETWNLGLKSIGPLLGIGAIYFAVILTIGVMVAVGLVQSLEPGIGDIVERLTSPDFNPGADPADEAFLDSITFEPSASFWALVVVGVVVLVPASILAYSMSMIALVNRHFGGSMRFGEIWRTALRRFKRTFAISLLWGLSWSLALAIVVGVWVVAIIVPLLLLFVVPATIALFVYCYPFMWLAIAPLFAGPTHKPPFRTLVALVRPRWTAAAGSVLLINLVIFAINVGGTVLGLIPLVGVIAGIAASIAQWVGQYASAVIIWDDLGGDFDPALTTAD